MDGLLCRVLLRDQLIPAADRLLDGVHVLRELRFQLQANVFSSF